MATQCPKCNADNLDTQSFCGDCGTQLGPSKDIGVTKTIETPAEEYPRGSTFADRYKIIEKLGIGGMGAVYRVEDTNIGQDIALKLIKPDIASDKKTIERFRNELKTTRMISHRNVCRMFDLAETEGTYYITMEYVPGEDLKSFIRRSGKLDIPKALSIAKEVCEGLSEAHRLGVVHRDLKSNNIMIDKEGNARIMDFGIARSISAKGLTGEGIIIGTPEYMSPEQAEAKEVDHRSDIYSLGVILYEMVTGALPFEGDTPLSIAMKHKGEKPKDPKSLNPQIRADLNVLILKCLEKDKEKRYQSAEELHAGLNDIEKGIPSTQIEIAAKKPLTSKEITVTFGVKKVLIPALIITAGIIIGLILWQPWSKKAHTPAPTDRPSLAILYFENTSGSESLDGWRTALSDLMITDLAQSKFIHVLPGDRIYSILNRLNLFEVSRYSTENLIKIANEGGVNHVGYGGLIEAGNKIIINFTLKNPYTDDIVSSVKKECESEEDIAAKVDELTDEIKLALNLSQEQIASDLDREVRDISTSSPQALKYYGEGRLYQLKGETAKAFEMFKKAVEVDPEFAMAYRALGVTATTQEEKRSYHKKAFELRDKASERGRLSIEGTYYSRENNLEKAIEAYEKLLLLYPEDGMRGNLGNLYIRFEQWEKALDHLKISKRFFPEGIYLINRGASIYMGLNQYENAQKFVEDYMNQDRDHPWLRRKLALIYFEQGHYELAHAEIDKAISMRPADHGYVWVKANNFLCQGDYVNAEKTYHRLFEFDAPLAKINGRDGLGNISLFRGKLKQAQKEFIEGIGLAREAGEIGWEVFFHRRIAHTFQRMGNLEEAMKELEEAWKLAVEEGDFDDKMFTLYNKGVVQSKMGLMDEVQKAAAELKALIESGLNKKKIRLYHHLMGLIEYERNNYSQAIEYFRQGLSLLSYGPLTRRADFIESLALAYHRSGEIEKAQIEYEKITQLTEGKIYFGDIYAKSFYRLGKIFEEQGETAKAIEHYEKFLDLWKDADPCIAEVSLLTEDARKRLAWLKGN